MNDPARAAASSSPTLIADIGGTNARFALAQNGQVLDVVVLAGRDYDGLAAAATAFLETIPEPKRPRQGIFAIAAPINGDQVQLTNLPWAFSTEQLRRDLKFNALDIVNDFTAIGWAVPHLKADETLQVGGGTPCEDAPIALLGPGSGLGVAALIPVSGGWTVLPGEGGHVTMAATTSGEERVLDALRQTFDHVSAERVLSGPGLVNIYTTLVQLDGQTPEPLNPEQISASAQVDPGSHAGAALSMFCDFLGTAASNMALVYNARGGVYLGGGIVGKLGSAFTTSGFRQRFEAKGRFSAHLSQIPTFIINHPFPALAGLAKPPHRSRI